MRTIPKPRSKNVIAATLIAAMSVLSLSSCDNTVSRETLIKQYENTEKYRKEYEAHCIEMNNKINQINNERQGNNDKVLIKMLAGQYEQAEKWKNDARIKWDDAVKIYNESCAIARGNVWGNGNSNQEDDINIPTDTTWSELPKQLSPDELGL